MRLAQFLIPALLLGASPAVAAATDSPTTATNPTSAKTSTADTVVCKKTLKTGTLASYAKECHTKAEWNRIAQNERDSWGELQGTHGSTSGK